ncbi:gliding motility-associated C-terminal domain-containing protein [Ekhidna sp.]|uniref:T9SS type B sorting domain-containing protein n=1 Tax=Ekhidna sp. TaxID=2608089 RepID=UPI003299B32D
MKRYITVFSLFLVGSSLIAQINLGDSTTVYLGDSTIFFFGGNTTLNGSLNNSGTIVSYSDMDLVKNGDIGNIKFTGVNNQKLIGDTIELDSIKVNDFIVNKQGTLQLLTSPIDVLGEFITENGIIEADADAIFVSGSTMDNGSGYVEGKLFGKSRGNPITFPMGVNGAPNYVTISNLPNGTILSVECKQPNSDSLFLDENMLGISRDVEWVIKLSASDSLEAQMVFNYSGVTLTNEKNIRAKDERPGLVLFSKVDTLFHEVNATNSNISTGQSQVINGILSANSDVVITREGRRFAIALIPSIDQPTLFVPNAFSPTATIEENRIFRAFYAGAVVKEVSIAVYDSFNKQVYTANDSGDELDLSNYGWNGVLNSGLDAPEGVYYYTVRVVTDEGSNSKTASFILIR